MEMFVYAHSHGNFTPIHIYSVGLFDSASQRAPVGIALYVMQLITVVTLRTDVVVVSAFVSCDHYDTTTTTRGKLRTNCWRIQRHDR